MLKLELQWILLKFCDAGTSIEKCLDKLDAVVVVAAKDVLVKILLVVMVLCHCR